MTNFIAVNFLDIFLNADALKDPRTYRENYDKIYKVRLYGFWNRHCSRKKINA